MTGAQIGWAVAVIVLLFAAVGTVVYALRLRLRNQWAALAWASLCVTWLVLAFIAGGRAIYG